VCGLPQLTKDFACLPPHFKDVGDGPEWQSIDSAMSTAFPYHEKWEESFHPVVIYMLASVVHHADWLRAKVPLTHPVRRVRLFEGSTLYNLQPFLAQAKDEVTMSVTGVDAWCYIFINMNEMHTDVKEIKADVKELKDTIDVKVRDGVQTAMDERDTVNGTASLGALKSLITELNDKWDQRFQDHAASGAPARVPAGAAPEASDLPRTGYGVYFWAHDSGCKKHRQVLGRYVPKNFRLSYNLLSKHRSVAVDTTSTSITRGKVCVCDAWTWWWFGLQYGNDTIRPLQRLSKDPKFHLSLNNTRRRYNDIKQLILAMTKMIEDTGSIDDVSRESPDSKRHLFHQGWSLMVKFIQKNHPNRAWVCKTYKETVAVTTLKKHYSAGMQALEDRKRLLVLVQHLDDEEDGAFLKDVVSCDTWLHDRHLDLEEVDRDQVEFYTCFTAFLTDYTRPQQKKYIATLKRMWKYSGNSVPSRYDTLISEFLL
jgi:hypothetical protein